MASVEYEGLMQAWFPAQAQLEQKPLREVDIREIAQVLVRASRVSWSRIPRIYSVLKIIKQLEAIECFVDEGITDIWFPFSQKSLPSSFQPQSARSAFLDTQHLVFNIKAISLEQEHTRHSHFRDASEIPFKKIGELGQGGFGSVDRVLSTVTYREYARKLLPRGRTFKKNKEVLHAFEKELSSLKRLSRHRHVVDFIGSYTDPKYVGIITSPVADCNLHDYLARSLDDGQRSFLRTFFGCLTSALGFLHDSRIRHKDIKPQNILVKSEEIFLTDFGLALDWNEHSRNTTVGPAWQTPRYGAPEVAESSARNESADIWSLGCVFLEMWTVLNSEKIKALHDHMINTGDKKSSYCANPPSVESWVEHVKSLPGRPVDKVPAVWISNMLRHDRGTRWTARTLEERIYEHSNDPTAIFAFVGRCCLDDEDSEESVLSSADEVPVYSRVQPSRRSLFKTLHDKHAFGKDKTTIVRAHSSDMPTTQFEQATAKVQVPSSSLTATSGESALSHEKSLKEDQSKIRYEGSLEPRSWSDTERKLSMHPSETPENPDQHQRELLFQPYVEEEELSLTRELSDENSDSSATVFSAAEGGGDGKKTSNQWVFFSTGLNIHPQGEFDVQKHLSEEARRRSELRHAFLAQQEGKEDPGRQGARRVRYSMPERDEGYGQDHMDDFQEENVQNSRDSHRSSGSSSSDSNGVTVNPWPGDYYKFRLSPESDQEAVWGSTSQSDEERESDSKRYVYPSRAEAERHTRPAPVRTTRRDYHEPSRSSRHREVQAEPVRRYALRRETDRGIPEVVDWDSAPPSFRQSTPSPTEIRIPSTPQRFQTESSSQNRRRRSEKSSPRAPNLARSATMRREAKSYPHPSGFRNETNSGSEHDSYPIVSIPESDIDTPHSAYSVANGGVKPNNSRPVTKPKPHDSSESSLKKDPDYLHPSGRREAMSSIPDTNSEREDYPIVRPAPSGKTRDSHNSNDGDTKRKKVQSRNKKAPVSYSRTNNSAEPSQTPLHRTVLREPERNRHRSPSPLSKPSIRSRRPALHSSKYGREKAAEDQSDSSSHEMHYAPKYGPEDFRWAPRPKEHEPLPARKPKLSRTATYAY